ncbi:MAG: hypothetical protein ACM3UU_02025 [Ignavibacteriales bacterium]
MQNQRAKINYNDKAYIQDSKISRIHTEKKSKRTNDFAPLDYNEKKHHMEKDIHLVQENHIPKKNIHKPHNLNKSLQTLINRIMSFIKSDDALLIFVFILLIQDGIDDEILLGLIIYLFISDKLN